MNTPWLSPAELSSWVRLVSLMEVLPAALDTDLRTHANLTHFDYYVLAMLSESDGRTLRMTKLANQTNSTLPRLSHVVRRLQERGYVERTPAADDARATDVHLTDQGLEKVVATAPGHVTFVREHVLDALTPDQLAELGAAAEAIIGRVDRDGHLNDMLHRYDITA